MGNCEELQKTLKASQRRNFWRAGGRDKNKDFMFPVAEELLTKELLECWH